MSQRDLWEKAAECTRAAEATGDWEKRDVLIYLRDFWINLANASPDDLDDRVALDIAVIERMQAELIGKNPTH